MQDNVSLCDANGVEFARGLVNMNAEEVRAIAGQHGRAVAERLGMHLSVEEVVHR